MIKFEDLVCKKMEAELIPAIIQDSKTNQVLMLGYMNKEAYNRSLESGLVTFYSRSKMRLWTKGETSGNYLKIVSIVGDCDRDTILIKAIPCGPVCHTGSTTCFGNSNSGFIKKLEGIIDQRYNERPENSYTTRLFDKGVTKIAQKVGEEAVETVIEAIRGDKSRLIYELGDLVYHSLVLMKTLDISLEDIENELASRER